MSSDRPPTAVRPGRRAAPLLALLAAAACAELPPAPPPPPPPPLEATLFREVTAEAGIARSGPSFGLSVGDFDGDQFPDVWASNHWRTPSLYRNGGDGTFRESLERFVGNPPGGDFHGAAWADFDRDGDLDLIELAGANRGLGSGPNRLFVQEAGRLRNRARERGVDAPQGRARTPHWLDWEADGDLDLLMTGILRPDGKDWSGLFLQDGARRPAAFDRAPMDVLGRPQGFLFAQLADVTGDAWPELLMADRVYPRRALAFGAAGSGEVTGRVDLQRVDQVDDAVWADFDGDLRSDVFMATSRGGPSFSTPAPEILEAALHGTHLGVRFRSAGPVRFRVYPQNSIEPGGIFIGARAANPRRLGFRVDPANPGSHGLADYRAGEDSGLYIGFDPGEGLWTVMQSHPSWRTINVLATGQKPVTEVVSVRFAPRIPQPDNRLFIRQSRGFADRTVEAMLHGGVAGLSVVAGDFDHDMDVDLYLLSSGPIDNEPNLLYLNQGDGTFRSVAGAGGAAGSLLGRADAVATLDYDRDGDLDLFVVNGLEAEPFSTDGPHQLFENVLEQGDGTRHWLEIDLEGTRSNVEAIGARVEVTAGGTAQVRLQDHGMHRATQNDPLLHFGLGPNPRADEVVVHWPSGRIQRLRDVPADHLLKVVETP